MLKTITKEPLHSEKATPDFLDSTKDSQGNGPCHLWGIKEVAAYLNVKESTIRNWVFLGYIPHIKFRGAVRFQQTAITDWIKSCVVFPAQTNVRNLSGDILRSINRRS